MAASDRQDGLEAQFGQWRQYVQRRQELQQSDAEELEDHLRGSVDELIAVGLHNDYGTTPNKASALGENAILLANLAWSAWLVLGFVRRRTPFAALERWQTGYLPVYAAWAWTVVLVFPPLFGYR